MSWLNKAKDKIKADWQASRERAKEQAVREKALRDEARAIYIKELDKQRTKEIQKIAVERAKLDAKLKAQKLFAPQQSGFGKFIPKGTSPQAQKNLDASLNALVGVGVSKPRRDELKASLKSKMKKGVPKPSVDDLIWKY